MTSIKNCGLKSEEAIHEAARTGASYVGFVHHLASPRHLDFSVMARLSALTPDSLKQVVVLVDPSFDLLDELLKFIRPHFLQVHRVNDPQRIAKLQEYTGIPVIAAISVRDRNALIAVESLENVSAHILFDAYHPHQEGGGGEVFDWSLLRLVKLAKPWFLAGGLTAMNVGEALTLTGAPMVDVSSGIEDSPGNKSLEKIAAFNAAVLQAGHEKLR
jgi:phosphoribosylanthranilate isomerase